MARMQKLVAYRIVADKLNEMGIEPYSARQWSQAMVQSVVYGKVKNQDIKTLVGNVYQQVIKENN
jgi:hypothetical protein